MKKLLLILATVSLAACQTTPNASNQVYGLTPQDFKVAANQNCPKLVQISREYREQLTITPDMVVRWSNENTQGAPKILLVLNNKGVNAYNAIAQKSFAPALQIGRHVIVPSSESNVTQGFLTLDQLPANWSEACTQALFGM